jgi:hypothetical protein
MILYNFEQHSEAWFEARAGKVTGTRFASLVSGKTTKGYQDLVADLTSEIITGVRESGFVSADMERGTLMEPFAREWYTDNIQPVQEVGFITPDEDSPFAEWVGISPDGLGNNYGLEIKCPKAKTLLNYIEGGKLPSTYTHQVQGSLWVTKYEFWDFLAYVEGMKPFLVRVEPDEALFKLYEECLGELIEQVKNKLEIYKNYSYE